MSTLILAKQMIAFGSRFIRFARYIATFLEYSTVIGALLADSMFQSHASRLADFALFGDKFTNMVVSRFRLLSSMRAAGEDRLSVNRVSPPSRDSGKLQEFQ